MSGEIASKIPVSEIADMLRLDAVVLARQLLPQGAMIGGEWKCSGENSPTGTAISVCTMPGPKQGVCGFWNGDDRGGDILDLIGVVNGFSKKEAVGWAKEWLGILDSPATALNLKSKRNKVAKVREERKIDGDERARRNFGYARELWRTSLPLFGAGAAYLRYRGLDPTFAEDLRSCMSVRHPSGGSFPALIGRVENEKAVGIGVWRIYLKVNGDGKAPVDTPKLGLGAALGGAVRLGGIGPEIAVAEGIETAVAVRQLIAKFTGKRLPVWAALSTSGMRALAVPPEITTVRIYADGDTEKFRRGKLNPSPGLSAAKELANRLQQAGVTATIEEPPAGMDWLEVFNAQAKIAA